MRIIVGFRVREGVFLVERHFCARELPVGRDVANLN